VHMFYRVMKGIYQFSANLLSYIPTKYYWNRSTSHLVIAKSKRVNFFLKHSVEWFGYLPYGVKTKPFSYNTGTLHTHNFIHQSMADTK